MIIAGRDLVRLGAVGLVAVAIGLAGCKSSGERSMGQKMSDRELAKRVEKNLSNDAMYKYPDVKVNVYDGTAQLSGFADKPEQRQRAAELAAQASGVREVINQIMLKPAPTGPATIRNPAGNETGRMTVDTNAPPTSQGAPEQPGQLGKMPEEINPNR